MRKKVGFVCFGEINTPYERLVMQHDHGLKVLSALDADFLDAGLVIDDVKYETADAAIEKLSGYDMCCLVVCVAGWIPAHAVIRVTDVFRNTPMLLWGLCGWKENGRIVTTSNQAGTSGLRGAFEDMGYRFKYVYNVIDQPDPVEKLFSFINASYSAKRLRTAHIGTMGYRDMLLYSTQFEGNSLRARLGIEVEPFEMLEIVQNVESLDPEKIKEGVRYVRENWRIVNECEDSIIEKGVKYALAVGKKIEERGYEAISLVDVDGMKKLLGFPPAMVFMLLEHYYGVETTPENDIMGSITQLMMRFATGQTIPYMEYYEYFQNSMLLGVPDYVPAAVTDGEVTTMRTAFGLLSASLLNVSKVKPGYVTCARLLYKKGKYVMHMYTGEAKAPPAWAEYGWEEPVPQLPSLEVFPDSCTVEEFAQKVCSQHVILCYGDQSETMRDLCALLGIEVI